MPVPPEHLERLEEQLSEHESRLRTLRRKIEAVEAEASAHQMMLRLGRDPDLRRALDELHDRPELAERIAKDPRSYFEEKGINVPDGATVATDPERSAIEARLIISLTYDYGVGWSRLDGFYLIPAPEPPDLPDAPSRKGE